MNTRPWNNVTHFVGSILYQAQLSFPVYLLPSIHLTRPTETMSDTYGIYGMACLVWHQSASNNNQADFSSEIIFSIKGWRIFLFHGGFVMMIPLEGKDCSNTQQFWMPESRGFTSLANMHLCPFSCRCWTNAFLPAQGSMNSVFSGKWYSSGITASYGVS